MPVRTSRLDWLVFLALGFMWGSSYLFIKIGVRTLEPFTLIALRLGIGLLVLVTVVRLAHVTLPRDRRIYGHLLVMGVINISLPFFLITWAEQTTESAIASILTATVPLMVIVIAAGVLQDEPISVNRLAGLLVGFAGVVVLVGRSLGSGSSSVVSELALLGSSVSYAAGAVYARRNVHGLQPTIPALFQVGFAFVICATLALLTERPFETQVTVETVYSVVWLGILGSGFAYLAFFRLLGRLGATRTSMVAYLLPVVGIVLGFLVLNEPVDYRLVVGTGLIIGGVALVNSRYGTRRLFGRVTASGEPAAADRS